MSARVQVGVQVQEVRGKARATPLRAVTGSGQEPQRFWITARGD